MRHPNLAQNAIATITMLLVIPAAARSQKAVSSSPSEPDAVRLTWNELLTTIDNHPLIAAGEQAHQAAVAQINTTAHAANPTLEAAIGYGDSKGSPDRAVEWGVTLDIPLSWLATRRAMVESAKATANVREEEKRQLRQALLVQLIPLFFNLVRAEKEVDALEAVYEETALLHRTVDRRVALGEARPVEATRMAVELGKIKADLETAKVFRQGHEHRLSQWLKYPSDTPLIARSDLTPLPAVSVEEAIHAVIENHPALKVQAAIVREHTSLVKQEKRLRFPPISAQLFVEDELDRRAMGGGLSIELPVWTRNRSQIKSAAAQEKAETLKMTDLRMQLEKAAIEAQTQCQAAAARATIYRNNIIPNAEKAVRTVTRTYEMGEAPLLDVIDVRRILVETRQTLSDAQLAAQVDCMRLYVLMGREKR